MTALNPSARVLVIDDDLLLRRMAVQSLRHAGFEVAEAADGHSGLAGFRPGQHDLILLDVMMPDVDGYEVCRQIRALPGGEHVPVIMLTGLNDTHSIELAYAAGATDFISKPIHWGLLGHRVRYALRASAAIASATRSRERLERAQHIAQLGSWEIVDGRVLGSGELLRLYGLDDTAQALGVEAFTRCVVEGDRDAVARARAVALARGTPYQLTFRIRRPDGAVRTLFEEGAAVRDAGGRVVAIEGIAQDVTARVEAEHSIRRLARYDLLTALPNRAFFHELCDAALERLPAGQGAALLYLDVDRFKSVNDAYGHAQGDALLRTLAQRLQHLVAGLQRGQDVLLGRVGANAYTVLLARTDDERQIGAFATRLQSVLAQPVAVDSGEVVLSASIGIAMAPRDATQAPGLVRCAEQALYDSKSDGSRGRLRFYDPAMNAEASARLAREGDLRRAIADGQLLLHYQPKVDATSGRIVGAEALVRWRHAERGLVPPGEFIPLAEETGLILPLTDWVLDTACADQRRRLDAGLPELPVAVNLSAPSFAQADLPDRLDALLARHQVPARLLTLEVTESLLMQDVERAAARLEALRSRGFAVALDDFGTGYSSLSYLKRFPIDELKIDRAFVTDVARGGRDGALATAIIALAREFGLRVVAEGVETIEQAQFLVGHGCCLQQGFLYARPLPTPEYDALMRQQAGGERVATASRAAAARTADTGSAALGVP